jgi:hypothetical protein
VKDSVKTGVDRDKLRKEAASSWKQTESAKAPRPRPKDHWVDAAVQRLQMQGEIDVQKTTIQLTDTPK